jgi:hypothetical protein
MGLLSKLFGGGAPRELKKVAPHVRFFGDIIDISQRGMFGLYSRSPNERFILAWRDSNEEGTHGGARTSGLGRYVLLDNGKIACEGRLERPNDGKVADTGVFVVNDWHFFTIKLHGTFYAFRPNGSEILHQRYNANLYNNGVSRDGRHAACHTCNSDDERDSAVLTIFDLEAGSERTRWRADSGWANGYEFSADGSRVWLDYPHGLKLAFTLDGDFLDRQVWIDDGLARGDIYMVARILRELGDQPPADTLMRLIVGLDVGLKSIRDSNPRSKAYALRLKGECHDRLGDFSVALECYEAALGLDPKVGAKRRASQLRKMLMQGR